MVAATRPVATLTRRTAVRTLLVMPRSPRLVKLVISLASMAPCLLFLASPRSKSSLFNVLISRRMVLGILSYIIIRLQQGNMTDSTQQVH